MFKEVNLGMKVIILNHLVEEIKGYIYSHKKCLISISGHGAAGKTTFAEAIMKHLESNTYNYLNTDPYITQGEYRKPLEATYRYKNEIHKGKVTACLPVAHELESLTRDLKMLKTGMDFLTIDAHWAPAQIIHAERYVTIVDGMSTAFLDQSLFDLSIYIYTDGKTEMERRMKRDVDERGRSAHTLMDSHKERRIQYELFMHDRRADFDIIVNDSGGRFVVEKGWVD